MQYNRILALLALLLLGTACKQYEDMPEGNSYSTTSITLAQEEALQLFRSSEHGWLLTLQPDGGRYGGRALVLKFTDASHVSIYSEEGIYPADASAGADARPQPYQVTSTFHFSNNAGVRITFDTFNYQLHRYSDPYWGLNSSYNGDSDFIIEGISEDRRTITLRGGRTKAIQTMTRMDSDPEEYVVQVSQMREQLQGKALSPITLGGTEVSLSIFSLARQLWVRYGDTNTNIPIVFTPQGLRLLSPLTIGGETLSELHLNEAKTAMTTPDGAKTLTLYSGRYDFTRGHIRLRYSSSTDTTSTTAYQDFIQMEQIQANTYYPGTFDPEVFLGYSDANTTQPSVGNYADLGSSYRDFGHYYLDFTAVYGQPDQLHLTRFIQQGLHWFYVHDALDAFVEALVSHSPYTMPDFADSTTHSSLQSVADPSGYWIYVEPGFHEGSAGS